MSVLARILLLVTCALLTQGGLAAPSSTKRQAPVVQSITLDENLFDPQALNDTVSFKQTKVGCTRGKVDPDDLERALTCFGDWCAGNKLPPHAGEHCTVGYSMIYACNYGGWNPCYTYELVTAWGAIQRDCGVGNAGWWFNPDWGKTYGIDSAGANICSNL
ncbi:hypothetical protein QBC44DRAFT_364172 [Cladorrhinum sp. PSN332]|nr:hypothetical protein QBC44DRAFT_364172 [Cladorrhinum sp. PSN332]